MKITSAKTALAMSLALSVGGFATAQTPDPRADYQKSPQSLHQPTIADAFHNFFNREDCPGRPGQPGSCGRELPLIPPAYYEEPTPRPGWRQPRLWPTPNPQPCRPPVVTVPPPPITAQPPSMIPPTTWHPAPRPKQHQQKQKSWGPNPGPSPQKFPREPGSKLPY